MLPKDHSYPQKPLLELQHAPLEQGIVAVQLPTGRDVVLSGVCAIVPEEKATWTRQFRQTMSRGYVESQSMPEVIKSEYIAKCDEGSITARMRSSLYCT